MVWTLTLQSESEGSALISCTARLLRKYSVHEYYFAPSFTLKDHVALHEHGYTHPASAFGFSRHLIDEIRLTMQQHGMMSKAHASPPHVVRVGSYTLRKAQLQAHK